MRLVTSEEIKCVSGGFGLVGIGLGSAIGLAGGLYSGASGTRLAAAVMLGGLSGATGNLAGSAAAGGMAMRTAWGVRSIGLGFAGGATGGSGKDEEDS